MTASIITIGNRDHLRPTTPPAPVVVFSKTFDGKPGLDFSALNDAETYLRNRGFSFGPGCAASGKAGILFGRIHRIAKWRNLTALEQQQCHGVIEGDRRSGPVTIKVFFHAPAFAIAAVSDPDVAGAIVQEWSEQR